MSTWTTTACPPPALPEARQKRCRKANQSDQNLSDKDHQTFSKTVQFKPIVQKGVENNHHQARRHSAH